MLPTILAGSEALSDSSNKTLDKSVIPKDSITCIPDMSRIYYTHTLNASDTPQKALDMTGMASDRA